MRSIQYPGSSSGSDGRNDGPERRATDSGGTHSDSQRHGVRFKKLMTHLKSNAVHFEQHLQREEDDEEDVGGLCCPREVEERERKFMSAVGGNRMFSLNGLDKMYAHFCPVPGHNQE